MAFTIGREVSVFGNKRVATSLVQRGFGQR
jgi:hypothetical protein